MVYSNYEIGTFIFPNSGSTDFATIFSNYFGTQTLGFTYSYHGSVEACAHKYMVVNHFVTWGKVQTYSINKNDGVNNFHYVGCYPLSYYEDQKKEDIIGPFKGANKNKKSIVFFDNKV